MFVLLPLHDAKNVSLYSSEKPMRIDKNTNATILARILPVNNNDVRVSVLKDIGWPHAVIAVVGLIIIFLLNYLAVLRLSFNLPPHPYRLL